MEAIFGFVILFSLIYVPYRILKCLFPEKKRCHICEDRIKKLSYRWSIEGKTIKLCPKCNRRMEERQSRIKFDEYFKK